MTEHAEGFPGIRFAQTPQPPEARYRYAAKVTQRANNLSRALGTPISQIPEFHKTAVITGVAAIQMAIEGDFPVRQREFIAIARMVMNSHDKIPAELITSVQKSFTHVKPKNPHIRDVLVRLMAQKNRKRDIEEFASGSAATAISRPDGNAGQVWDFLADVLAEAAYISSNEVIDAAVANPGGFLEAATRVCRQVRIGDIEIPKLEIGMPDINFPEISCPEMSCPDISCPDVSCPDVSCPDNCDCDCSS